MKPADIKMPEPTFSDSESFPTVDCDLSGLDAFGDASPRRSPVQGNPLFVDMEMAPLSIDSVWPLEWFGDDPIQKDDD